VKGEIMPVNSDVEKNWLKAVENLGKDVDKKLTGDLILDVVLTAAHLPFVSPELREKSGLVDKLESVRNELNDREQRMLIGFKILKEKGLL